MKADSPPIYRSESRSNIAARFMIAANALWVLACLGLLASSLVAPTMFGVSFLITQAVTVGVLLELEWIGVRKIQPEPAW
jgi:hypothetical protein